VAEPAVQVARAPATLVPPRLRNERVISFWRAVIFLSASAPVPVTSLYVEPGGKCSLIAWLSSG
jgi:hypothetical protein